MIRREIVREGLGVAVAGTVHDTVVHGVTRDPGTQAE
jgi:hypothetical protein